MAEENNKPKPEENVKEMKRKYTQMLADAQFWADDMGITLEELFSKHKKES